MKSKLLGLVALVCFHWSCRPQNSTTSPVSRAPNMGAAAGNICAGIDSEQMSAAQSGLQLFERRENFSPDDLKISRVKVKEEAVAPSLRRFRLCVTREQNSPPPDHLVWKACPDRVSLEQSSGRSECIGNGKWTISTNDGDESENHCADLPLTNYPKTTMVFIAKMCWENLGLTAKATACLQNAQEKQDSDAEIECRCGPTGKPYILTAEGTETVTPGVTAVQEQLDAENQMLLSLATELRTSSRAFVESRGQLNLAEDPRAAKPTPVVAAYNFAYALPERTIAAFALGLRKAAKEQMATAKQAAAKNKEGLNLAGGVATCPPLGGMFGNIQGAAGPQNATPWLSGNMGGTGKEGKTGSTSKSHEPPPPLVQVERPPTSEEHGSDSDAPDSPGTTIAAPTKESQPGWLIGIGVGGIIAGLAVIGVAYYEANTNFRLGILDRWTWFRPGAHVVRGRDGVAVEAEGGILQRQADGEVRTLDKARKIVQTHPLSRYKAQVLLVENSNKLNDALKEYIEVLKKKYPTGNRLSHAEVQMIQEHFQRIQFNLEEIEVNGRQARANDPFLADGQKKIGATKTVQDANIRWEMSNKGVLQGIPHGQGADVKPIVIGDGRIRMADGFDVDVRVGTLKEVRYTEGMSKNYLLMGGIIIGLSVAFWVFGSLQYSLAATKGEHAETAYRDSVLRIEKRFDETIDNIEAKYSELLYQINLAGQAKP